MFHYTDACRIYKKRGIDDFNRRIRCFSGSDEADSDKGGYKSGHDDDFYIGEGSREQHDKPQIIYDSAGHSIMPIPSTGYEIGSSNTPDGKEYDGSFPVDYLVRFDSPLPIPSLNIEKKKHHSAMGLLQKHGSMSLDLMLLTGNILYPEKASAFRDSMVYLVSSDGIDEALKFPDAKNVKNRLQELCDYANNNPDNLDRLELTSVFTRGFLLVHPFNDGNGRTSRALANFFLKSGEYFKALPSDRRDYRRACLEVDFSGDPDGMYKYWHKRLASRSFNN